MSNISDHKLTRMKKEDIIKLFRETEEKLFGFTASAEKQAVHCTKQVKHFKIQNGI